MRARVYLFACCIDHHDMSNEKVEELKETERRVYCWTWRCKDEEWSWGFDPHVDVPSHVELIAHVAAPQVTAISRRNLFT